MTPQKCKYCSKSHLWRLWQVTIIHLAVGLGIGMHILEAVLVCNLKLSSCPKPHDCPFQPPP